MALSVLLLPSISAAWAKPPGAATQKTQHIQRQQRERLRQTRAQQQKHAPQTNLEIGEQTSAPGPAAAENCRPIDAVRLEGASLLSPAERRELTQPYIGKCLTVADIERLMASLTKAYIDRGYVTARPYIRTQDLSKGVLRILVVQGNVEDIKLRDNHQDSVNLGTAFPGVVGEPLNLHDLEQGLDQINRLRSNHAGLGIEPGKKPGGSVVVIHNHTTHRIHAGLAYDNFGLESTGKQELAATIGLDNPLSLNDNLFMSYVATIGHAYGTRHSRAGSLFYTVPLGYFTFVGAHSHSDYATPVALPAKTLSAHGSQQQSSLEVRYLAWRDGVSRVSLSGSLTSRESENYLDDQFLSVSSRRLTTFDLGINWSTVLAGGLFDLRVKRTWGLAILDAMHDANGLPPSAPRAQFHRWTVGVSWGHGFDIGSRRFVYRSRLRGRYAQDVLFGSEQFSVGGLYSVRGFRDTTLSGDRGYFWRNSLAMPLNVHWFGGNVQLRPYIALDTGKIFSHYHQRGGRMTGAGLGLKVLSNNVIVQLLASRPLSVPNRLPNEGYEFFARVNLTF